MSYSLPGGVNSLYLAVCDKIRENRKPTIVVGTIGVIYLIRKVIYRLWRKWNNYPPGPSGLPWIGSLFSAIDAPKYASYLASSYGSISMIYIGNQSFVFLHSIDTINEVLKNKNALDRDSWHNTYMHSHLNESEMSLAVVNEKYWRAKRHHFQSNILSRVDSSFINTVHNRSLNSHVFQSIDDCIANDRLWNFSSDVNYIEFHSIWNACFGTFLDYGSKEAEKAVHFIEGIMAGCALDIFLRYLQISPFLPKIITDNLFTSYKEFESFLKTQLYKQLGYDESVFDENEHKWDAHFQEVREDPNACTAAKTIAFHRENDNVFTSINAIIGSFANLFLAGVDTSVQFIEYALVLLAKNPRDQQSIYQEISDVFSDDDIMNTKNMVSNINKLHLLKAFLNEVLRISSIIPLGIARYNSKCDIMVKSGKHVNGDSYECRIPKGTVIMPDIQCANRADIYWQQKTGGKPGELCMDAWLDSNGKFKVNLNKDKMLAFSCGPRNCAGQSLALKSAYFLLAKLMMRYEFLLPNGMKCDVEIKQVFEFANVMKPKIPLRVVKR